MEFVEISCELSCTKGGDIALRVYVEYQVVSLIGEEGGYTGGGVGSIVVSEFYKREEVGPVVLLVQAVMPKVLLKHLVCPFRLAICLWIISQSEV